MSNTLQAWALPRLRHLLPIDEDSLNQIITYTDSLTREQAGQHLKDILGDSAQALEFISSFNQRRRYLPNETEPTPAVPTSSAASRGQVEASSALATASVSKTASRSAKKKPNIHALPARQLEGAGDTSGSYKKQDELDYVPSQSRTKHKDIIADNLAVREEKPDATQLPLLTDGVASGDKTASNKLPPSAAGQLVSDVLAPKKSAVSLKRNASPVPKTKVVVSGGTAMHGASTTLSDLDSAIRSLELQTNPTRSREADEAQRQCDCMATRHPLLDIAPNCLNCGKIICVKQGLGPCTYCHKPLLTINEINKVLQVLKEERGEERMRINNAAHKKADVSHGKSRAFTGREFLAQAASARSSPLSSAPTSDVENHADEQASRNAKAHRDKLLNFQANNARRTQVHDEAADYDTPSAGTNMWASPAERAAQLKRQQRVLQEMEWNARPEYEQRRMVASIDVVGGKIVRRMAPVEKPVFDATDDVAAASGDLPPPTSVGNGAFSDNPLLGQVIRPTARVSKEKGVVHDETKKKSTWRRVQMDDDDNEQWILDGGLYGGRVDGRVLGSEEHSHG